MKTDLTFNEIISYYQLGRAWSYYDTYSTSKEAPYHNAYHTQCVTTGCYSGAQYYNLPYDATKQLLVAAIFHDFCHSGGNATDAVNIATAIAWVKSCYGTCTFTDTISKFISCTQYPFVQDPRTIEERIIRDADMLQISFPKWEAMLIDGLRQEMSISRGQEITEEEMWVGQAEFHKQPKFWTEWGNLLYYGSEMLLQTEATTHRTIIFKRALELKGVPL